MEPVENIKVLKVFHEATVSDRGGEVLLRCGDDTARVFFVGGKIAWATVSTNKRTFTEYLIEKSALKKDEVQEVFEECKRTGKNFGETIVEWELLDEQSLRNLLLRHLSECLLEVFRWPSVESMFMPEDRPYKGSLTFDLVELLESVMQLDAEGKLPFSGHAMGEILDELGAGGQVQPEEETATTETVEEASEKQWGKETTQPFVPAFPERDEQEDPLPEPEAEPAEPPVRRGKGKFFLLTVLLIAVGAAAYFLSDRFFGNKTAGSEEPQTRLVAVPGQADADAGVKSADEGVSAAADAGTLSAADAGVSDAEDAGKLDGTADVLAPAEKTGSIKVLSKPKRASVYLDGIYTGRKTPCTLRGVQAGSQHVVLVVKKGRREAHLRLGIDEDRQSIARLVLKRSSKHPQGRVPVKIESDPPGAAVYVNGGKVKKTTPTVIKLKTGRDTKLQIRKDELEWTRTVRPVPGEIITIRAKLK
ncbi:MAG TPA: PEGA domain-containing protein [Myxococcota bacterium]|nr:PEGA domain-containing protein [Myxococcota bacterium]